MAHQARTETTGLDPPPVTAVTDDGDSLSMFPSETPDGHVHRVSRRPPQVRVPSDTYGSVGARGDLEQLGMLAARLESQYERLAKGLSEADTRSAAALDTLRNVERQAAELTAELNRLETQTRALLDAKPLSSQTDRTLETETPQGTHVAARNIAETGERSQWGVTGIANRCMQWVTGIAHRRMQWWGTGIANRRMQVWVAGIANRRIPATGLVALVLVSLAIVPSLMRLNQIRVAPVAVSATVAGDPTPSRTTDISLPFEQDLKIPDPSDAPKVPNRTVPLRSSNPLPVKQGGTAASAGNLKVPNQTNRSQSSTPPSLNQPRASAYVGNLAVHSTPAGATVLVDGRSAGITPLQLTALPARNYVVWLELKGYERWTNSVLVPAAKLTRVAVTLQPVRTAPSPIK
jgi:PEGA domain